MTFSIEESINIQAVKERISEYRITSYLVTVLACSQYCGHADPVAGGRAGEDVEVAVGRDAGAGDQYCPGLYEEGGPPCLSVLS